MVATLTAKQTEALVAVNGAATHTALRGGSRSGKSVLICRNIILRALKAPGSRHAIFRFRFSHCKQSIGMETLPFVFATFFPVLAYKLDRLDWLFKLPNGSEIWIGGLDDKDRTEKILGKEYVTVFLNECSQISWAAAQLVTTRLAQKVYQKIDGVEPKLLKPRMYYDYNPPPKSDWTYKVFEMKSDPTTRKVLVDAHNYSVFKINPEDNKENLAEGYLDTLKNASSWMRKRFYEGEYADDNPNALFNEITFGKWRVTDGVLPEFVRVVVAVDPSGAGDDTTKEADAIGIVAVGLGTNGVAYLIEDCTLTAGPATWGRVVTSAFDRHAADVVIGETNYGGEMVKMTIQASRPHTPYKPVHASRGKAIRAQPVAALYDAGKVRHVGEFRALEDELLGFSTHAYIGSGSPNRADALVWAIYDLFPALTRGEKKTENFKPLAIPAGRGFWR